MPIGDPICPIHGLIRCNCAEELFKMNRNDLESDFGFFRKPYKVPRRLVEISDKELEEVWEIGLRMDVDDAFCNVQVFRKALEKLLNV